MRARFRRLIGTDAAGTYFTVETIRLIIQHFGQTPRSLVGLAMSCWISTSDFSVIQLLVTPATVLAQNDLDQFSEGMQRLINVGHTSWDNEKIQPLCLFCESLSRMVDESFYHFELCRLVWEYGFKIASNIGYIRTYEIDSRISEGQRSLENLITSACHNVDCNKLQEAVKGARIDTSSITDCDTGDSLLHTLVLGRHRGLKPSIGRQAWEERIELMLDILLGNGCSLSSRNNEGHTPLSLAMEEGETHLAKIILGRKEFECNRWDFPVPILLLVAKSGSERVLDQLLDLGLPISPVNYTSKSPLHCLQRDAELGLAIRLEQLLPGSRELRRDGKMAWEHYLCNTDFDPRSSDVLSFLIQPLLDLESLEVPNIWESYITNLSRHPVRKVYVNADQTIRRLVLDGVFNQFEKARSKSGLLSFDSIFSAFSMDSNSPEFPITDATIRLLLERTEYWTSFRDSDCAVHFLKLSAHLHYDDTVSQLLRRGVGVHRRVKGVSALEHVYARPAEDDEDVLRIQDFLQYADSASMNQTNPTSGLGLIHLTHSWDEEQFRRKILEITVKSGASPNLRIASDVGTNATSGSKLVHLRNMRDKEQFRRKAPFKISVGPSARSSRRIASDVAVGFTGLLFHLDQGNFGLACALLEQGADPLMPSLQGWTAIHMAAARDATTFLSSLLLPREPKWTIDWERRCQCVLNSEVLDDASPLHLAAAESGDFLALLLDKVPSINLEATARNGMTALHWAAVSGRVNSIETLVSRGANVNARAADGQLALHIAVTKGNIGLVERLLELNSETTARLDGMTPLLLACQTNNQPLIDCLKSQPGNTSIAVPLTNKAPSSVLAKAISSAVQAGNLSACETLLSGQSSVDIDISEGHTSGFTPLAVAIIHGMLQIVEWLLEKGANANCHNGDGTSAIQGMIRKHALNSILPTMLDKYLAHGGSILSESTSLVYIAVDVANTEGVNILLDHLQENEKEYGSVWFEPGGDQKS